ncbi:MAG: 3'-5' exonuclease [Bacteroidales bacterium]|nr:3'-5' exonuclease [Bacteroidales bacterium]
MNREFSSIIEGLNPAQKQAVEEFTGPSLIIAGAGSGKTRVLTCRIANVLSNGHKAGSILALTFTNKASKEMKERISSLVGYDRARYLWMGTFHSVFVRFLREDAGLIGFPTSFTIYDTSDSRSAIRNCVKELSLDEKIYKPNEVLSRISMAKNNLITSSSYLSNATLQQNDAAARKPRIGEIYALYEKRCRQSGAMDFDDILLYTNILIRDFPEVLDKLRNRFSFILVDEYQDTNFAQWLIVKKLSEKHRNLCVVGDDSQSIYAFRGARIENILNFKKDYPEAKEFRLEQNYRSTQTIVNAANSLISRNSLQLKKECFSAASVGENIEVVKAYTDQEESFLLASSIVSKIYKDKSAYSEFAVLYRTNAQSRAVEEALRKRSLPYKIYGGHSFYDRAEVKDMMAYLRLLVNPKDDEAFRRAIKVSGKGIGDTTMGYLSAAAAAGGVSMWEAIHTGDVQSFGIKSATYNRFMEFCGVISDIRSRVAAINAYDIAMEIFIRSGYATLLKSDTTLEGQSRAENVEELFNSIKAFVEEQEAESDLESAAVPEPSPGQEPAAVPEPSPGQESAAGLEPGPQSATVVPAAFLGDYLETISLMSVMDDNKDEDSNKISLMTAHSAKGLEFTHVFIIGLEENLFPSVNSSSSENEIEEERRLMYVAITRAKKSVTISYAQSRFRWGSHVSYPPSRFLREINPKFLNWPDLENEKNGRFGATTNFGADSGSYHNSGSANRPGSFNRPGAQPAGGGESSMPAKRASAGFTHPKPADPNFIADPISKLAAGQKIEHDRFGFGQILSIEGDPLNLKAVVDFDEGGRKILLLKFAKLRIIE